MVEDIKTTIVKSVFEMSGNIIVDQLSKSDFEARRVNIEQYYKDLQPIRETLPDAPEIPEVTPKPTTQGPREDGKSDKIVGEICTPDLSPKELSECKECVESVVKDPNVLHKYMKPSL